MGFKIGVEIEGCFNLDNFQKVYEDKKINEYFNIVSDGSLSYSRKWDNETNRELVGYVKKNKNGFFNSLKCLEKISNCDLNELVDFNSSTGTHIHFEFDKIKFKNIPTKWLYPLRRRFFKKLSESNIQSKELIKRQYFRNYAKQITNKNNWYHEKYSEFNLLSEHQNKGFEWRAINLRGVQSWKELNELFKIVYDCLIWYEKYLNKKYTTILKSEYGVNNTDDEKIFEKLISEDLPNGI